jgi:SSS family solute:Na+ symporter
MNIALVLIAIATVFALVLGIVARSRHEMSLEQWTVGGRRFGALLVFLLLAGEIYTTFTFLGASGYAYGLGAPAYYILSYGTLAYVISYFILPKIWTYARNHELVSQPDFFAHKYNSPALGVLVALVGVIALVPYLVLQLTGLGVIVQAASYGAVPKALSIVIGAFVVTLYVIISGIRGSAWTAIAKDIMILAVAIFLGFYLPIHYYGGIGNMFAAVNTAKPGFLSFAAHGQSISWFVSTVLLTALGFFMWPHSFGACYTARNEAVFRKNAIVLPLYQLVLLLIFFVGFTALLVVPGLKGAATNTALLKIVVVAFPPWVVGIVGAAGVLTALVPGSLIMMAAATLFSRNFIAPLRGGQSNETTVQLAKFMVPVVAIVGCYFAIAGNSTIVALLLMGYNFVTQFFPALIASLLPRNPVTKEGAFAGILAGAGTVVFLTLAHETVGTLLPSLPDVVKDFNVGIIALLVNLVVLVAVSAVTSGRRLPLAGQTTK